MKKHKYRVVRSGRFKRELKRAEKRGLNPDEAEALIIKLSDDIPLDSKYKDHPLHGIYINHRECHINPDWLLIYRKYEDKLILFLARTGTHSDLFD